MHRKFTEVCAYDSRDMQADKHTHTDIQTCSLQYFRQKSRNDRHMTIIATISLYSTRLKHLPQKFSQDVPLN